MNKYMRVAIIAGRAEVTCSSPSTAGRAARRNPDSRRQVVPEPQEVGPPDIDDLLQPCFATSLENRVSADAGINGNQVDKIGGAGHRSHLRGKIAPENGRRRNAGAFLLVGPIVRLNADAKVTQPGSPTLKLQEPRRAGCPSPASCAHSKC